jgi:hypothetical protein
MKENKDILAYLTLFKHCTTNALQNMHRYPHNSLVDMYSFNVTVKVRFAFFLHIIYRQYDLGELIL